MCSQAVKHWLREVSRNQLVTGVRQQSNVARDSEMAMDMRETPGKLGGSLEMSWPCIPSNVHLILMCTRKQHFIF